MLYSGIEASASNQVFQEVHNTLYGETSVSYAQYAQINSSETSAGLAYEVSTSSVVKEEFPYETPIPLATRNAEND